MTPVLSRGPAWSSWHTSAEMVRPPRAVLVPVGAVEQHGPHLPIGTDCWIATEVAAAVAAHRPDVLVGEPLPYGCSAHHRAFPGTVSLKVRTFIDVVCDVARCLHEDGLIPIFINGHGGNRGPLQSAAQALLEENVPVWAMSYFDLVRDEALSTFDAASMGHACALETSLMLHLWPDSVGPTGQIVPGGQGRWPDVSMYPPTAGDSVIHPIPFDQLDHNGVVGAPNEATPDHGCDLFASSVRRVGEAVDRILADAVEEGARHV